MQPPGFRRHPLSLIVCACVCAHVVWMCTDNSITYVFHRKCIYEPQWLLWDSEWRWTSTETSDWISITSNSPEQRARQPTLSLAPNTRRMCVLGSTNINWMLYYSCKLTQSLSVNPGLHAKHVHGKTKEVSAALSAEPSVATGLPWSQHSATVEKRGGSQMNSCRWKLVIVCLTLWSSYRGSPVHSGKSDHK